MKSARRPMPDGVAAKIRSLHDILPNGQHHGNLWIAPPFPYPEPERGRYSLICDTCLRIVDGFNWKCTSPGMFSEDEKTYLCDECKLLIHKSMPYKEYLKTPHWQAVREEALRRAKDKCQLCGSKDRLEVHHNTYERRGRERPEDVIAICHKCHSKHHEATCQAEDIFKFKGIDRPVICILPKNHKDFHRHSNGIWWDHPAGGKLNFYGPVEDE
jgi:hypothetical protein